ncbi:hypothetical protein [Magnetococcus sp. PR-3]|uniref:hypothetical protein n=1 Tax=Magnetococcus sp. PR-3 TaxID=3120355 RepID=UPI002FCE4640
MLRLGSQSTEPYWLEDLPYGVRFEVKPLTGLSEHLCQTIAQKRTEQMMAAQEELKAARDAMIEMGAMDPEATAEELENAAVVDNAYWVYLVEELAKKHLKDWDGVADEAGEPVELTPENICLVLRYRDFMRVFYKRFTFDQLLLDAAKKDSGVSALGTTAEAPTTAEDVPAGVSPAPEGSEVPAASAAQAE